MAQSLGFRDCGYCRGFSTEERSIRRFLGLGPSSHVSSVGCREVKSGVEICADNGNIVATSAVVVNSNGNISRIELVEGVRLMTTTKTNV